MNRKELWDDILRWVENPEEYDAAKMGRDFYALIDAECAEAVARQQQIHNDVAESLTQWMMR